jgi:hypothetical protein
MHAGNFDPPESEDGDAHVQLYRSWTVSDLMRRERIACTAKYWQLAWI